MLFTKLTIALTLVLSAAAVSHDPIVQRAFLEPNGQLLERDTAHRHLRHQLPEVQNGRLVKKKPGHANLRAKHSESSVSQVTPLRDMTHDGGRVSELPLYQVSLNDGRPKYRIELYGKPSSDSKREACLKHAKQVMKRYPNSRVAKVQVKFYPDGMVTWESRDASGRIVSRPETFI
ncbi:hypothetical protein C8J56DRAFT_1031627 [Mycena floridula]|nr:hypothetical protein C8J56DRAFT_1031627 [Mycena floridula]